MAQRKLVIQCLNFINKSKIIKKKKREMIVYFKPMIAILKVIQTQYSRDGAGHAIGIFY